MSGHGKSPGGRKARGGGHEEEHENHERWAVSYADMMTVLMALFLVLFAMSSVDSAKYEQLRDSLAAGFGNHVLDSGGSILADAGNTPNPVEVVTSSDGDTSAPVDPGALPQATRPTRSRSSPPPTATPPPPSTRGRCRRTSPATRRPPTPAPTSRPPPARRPPGWRPSATRSPPRSPPRGSPTAWT